MKKMMKHTPGSGEGRGGGSEGSERKRGEDGDLEDGDEDEYSDSGDSESGDVADGEVADSGAGLNSNNNGGCPMGGQLPVSPGSGSGSGGAKPGNGHLSMNATPITPQFNGYASGSPNTQQYYAQQLAAAAAVPPYLSPANSNNCGTSNASGAQTYATYSNNYCAPPSASPCSSNGSYGGSATRLPGAAAYAASYAPDVKFDVSLADGVNQLANSNGVCGPYVAAAAAGGPNGRYSAVYPNAYDPFYCTPNAVAAAGAHPVSPYVGAQFYVSDGAHPGAGSPAPQAANSSTGASSGSPSALGASGAAAAQYPFLISNYSPYYQWPGVSSFACELAGGFGGSGSGPNGATGIVGDSGCGLGPSFSSAAAAAAGFALGHHRALNGGGISIGGASGLQSLSPLSAASSAPAAVGPGSLAGAVGPLAGPPQSQLTAVL